MKIIAVLLLLIGLIKLCLIMITNKMESKDLTYNSPLLVDVFPEYFKALVTADGLVCIFGGIALLCL